MCLSTTKAYQLFFFFVIYFFYHLAFTNFLLPLVFILIIIIIIKISYAHWLGFNNEYFFVFFFSLILNWLVIYKVFSILMSSVIPSYISLTAWYSVKPMRRLFEIS
jgi:hypothetical protein